MSRSHLLETSGFNNLAKGRDGYYLYNRNDVYIGQAIEKYGEFSNLEFQVLRQLCAPGDIVIEVGANIGAHTVGLAKCVGEQGRVFAFEPQRLIFQTLCANVALNSLTNVECYWAALGAEKGVITVPELNPSQQNNFGGLSLLDAQQGHQVDCFTLDHFTPMHQVKLIKIDVEGMEAEVLRGGTRLLQKFKPLLYVENDRIEKSEALMRLISGLGYRMYWHMPPLFNPDNYYGETENIYPNLASFNMICIHRESPFKNDSATEILDFSLHPMRR